jgi:hypothetical protein
MVDTDGVLLGSSCCKSVNTVEQSNHKHISTHFTNLAG